VLLLKAKTAFAPTRPKDVFGSLRYKGVGKVDRGHAGGGRRRGETGGMLAIDTIARYLVGARN